MFYEVVFIFSLVCTSAISKIPDYIHVCKRNDPNLTQCILNSIEALRPKFVEGMPELDVPPIDPLYLPEMVFSKTGSFHAIGSDIVVHGCSNFQIKSLEVDIDKIEYIATLHFPLVQFDAVYDINAKFMSLPLKGKGPISSNATDVEGKGIIKGHKETVDGKTYVVFDDLELKLKMKSYHVRLENLFNGDETLGEAINAALNENKRFFITLLQPIAEEKASSVLLEQANKITKHFEFDELFPLD